MTDVFPFSPNWTTSPQVTLSYKTDIFKSRSGKEQRRALRSTPRRTVEFDALTCNADLVSFGQLMAAKQNQKFRFPDWTRKVDSYPIAMGATTFTVKTTVPEWLVAGAQIILMNGLATVLVTVEATSTFTVTLTEPVTQAFEQGAMVRPSFDGLLGSIQTTLHTDSTVTVQVSYDVTPASVPNSTNARFTYVTGGREVFPFRWNWGEDVSSQFDWKVETVDFGRGVTIDHRPVDFGTTTQQVSTLHTGSRIDKLNQFIERQKGQRGEFWMPSGTDDMVMLSATSSAFTVAGRDVFDTYNSSPVYSAVAIYMKDGRTLYRKIASIILSSGNSQISLVQPFTFTVTPAAVDRISWMRPARLGSDEATIEYVTDSVARWQATSVSVTYSSDPQNYADLDGAGVWIMDNWGDASEEIMDELDYMVNVATLFGDVRKYAYDAFDYTVNTDLWETFG